MPTITSQPSTSVLHAAYGTGLAYTVTQAYTSGDVIPAMKATITINGSVFSRQYYLASYATATLATFEINIGGIVQEYFRSTYGYPGTFTGATNSVMASALATVSVQFLPWLDDGNGLLEETGPPATSSNSLATNSAQASLSTFYASSGRKFLTNKPANTILKYNEGEVLAVYTAAASKLILKTYNGSGLQGTYEKTLPGSGSRIVAVPAGVPNLIALNALGWTSESTIGGDFLDGGISLYYTLQVTSDGPGFTSEVRTYYIDTDTTCLAYRIYFLNRLGFYDAVSLYQSTFNTYETTSELFEAPVSELVNTPRNRTFAKLENGFTLDFKALTDAEAAWLKELASTPDAYLTSIANPVIIKDASPVLKDTYAPMNELLLEAVYATLEYSQRN